MNTAVLYALLSLFFAGLNDLLFKRYSAKARSRGMMIFTIGLVWAALQLILMLGSDAPFEVDGVTVAYGLVAGLALTLSNLLLIESLTHIEVSLGSTIYRLNTLGVVVLSVLLLQESLGLYKVAGIASGVFAILLLLQAPGVGVDLRLHRRFVGLAILASLLRALYGVTTKGALNQGGDGDLLMLIAALCWIVGGAAYAVMREGRFRLSGKKLVYGVVSGLLVTLIVNFLVAAVALGEASVVIPIANLSFVAALLLSVALGWERLSARKLSAVACAVVSIWLLSR
ncbi:MAG: EamA family transporter [Candidatus Thiodiazotropha sp.]